MLIFTKYSRSRVHCDVIKQNGERALFGGRRGATRRKRASEMADIFCLAHSHCKYAERRGDSASSIYLLF